MKLPRPSPLAALALFVALGGTGYAVTQITGRQVVDSSLTGRDLRAHSIGAREVRRHSLTAGDFARGELDKAVTEGGLWLHIAADGHVSPGVAGSGTVEGSTRLAEGRYCLRLSIQASDTSRPPTVALATPDLAGRILSARPPAPPGQEGDCAGVLVVELSSSNSPADGGFSLAVR